VPSKQVVLVGSMHLVLSSFHVSPVAHSQVSAFSMELGGQIHLVPAECRTLGLAQTGAGN
jgi:hypothetical protein